MKGIGTGLAVAALALATLTGCGGSSTEDTWNAGTSNAGSSSTQTRTSSVTPSASAAAAEGAPVRAAPGSEAADRLLDAIPQDGIVLGEPDAPVTVVVFADIQCPYCKQFSRRVLPRVINRYVRPGRVKLVLRTLTFLGVDSIRGAQYAGASALQDKMWNVVEVLFRNQGGENTGWVTDDLLREVGAGVPGLDVERALAERGSRSVQRQLAQARSIALDYRLTSTPSFLIGETGGFVFPVPNSDFDGLSRAIDAALSNLSAG